MHIEEKILHSIIAGLTMPQIRTKFYLKYIEKIIHPLIGW